MTAPAPSAELLANTLNEMERKTAPQFEHCTDLGNAHRFAREYVNRVCYVQALGGWHIWDSRRWQHDETGEVQRLAEATINSIWNEVQLASDKKEREQLAQHALRSEAAGRLEALLKIARYQKGLVRCPSDFNADAWLLTVNNGTIDLRDPGGPIENAIRKLLREHRPEDYITKLAPVTFDPDATAPVFHAFLQRIFAGRESLIRFVQRAAGYSLTGLIVEQIILLLLGGGANGKSTFLELPRRMLGDYAVQTAFETLLTRENSTVRNDLARLAGARLVCAAEVEQNRRFDESLVKQLTGGEPITARFLFREFFTFDPTFTIWLTCNHRPRVRGTDRAIWRRLRVVPFDVTIPDEEQDRHLLDKLLAELPGILRWAVEGCLLWQREGLGTVEEVEAATRDYREQMDALAPFLAEYCVLGSHYTAPATQLYEVYRGWTQGAGEKVESQRQFGEWLRERGFLNERDSISGRKRWRGLALKELG